jgi:hypothetical protein
MVIVVCQQQADSTLILVVYEERIGKAKLCTLLGVCFVLLLPENGTQGGVRWKVEESELRILSLIPGWLAPLATQCIVETWRSTQAFAPIPPSPPSVMV